MADGDADGPRRPSTSGNLGTRTLSGFSATASPGMPSAPAYLQHRTMSTGVMSVDAGTGEMKKKKRFGTLRRMFRLND
jgi:serine/arginine repetitive matrix protein 2